MIKPPALIKGDKIGLVAPARKITQEELQPAVDIIRSKGFIPVYDERLFSADRQFAGNDKLRAVYFQHLLDNPEIKAIFSVRGGYGSVRIIDQLDFSVFNLYSKWLIGYSDFTVFHSHVNQQLGVQTLHATMPLNFGSNTPEALDGLFDVLQGNTPEYYLEQHPFNRRGDAKGILTGGNLSVLYSLLGSDSFPETEGKLLFIEDLDEYLYHVDRMMMALFRAGILSGLKGLIVGGMTGMNDNEIPFGKTAEQIIQEAVKKYDYPVCFGFPAGHIDNNMPLIMGAEVRLEVAEKSHIIFME